MNDEVQLSFDRAARLLSRIRETDYLLSVRGAAKLIASALGYGRKVIVFGNGGSASDAQHIAAELVGRFRLDRRPLPAIALGGNAVLTCIANEYGYTEIFARQIEALAFPGDIAWALSTSGNSENVVAGLKLARERGLSTILMTGNGGGEAESYADVVLDVRASETARIQEVHMISYHAICAAIEAELFPKTEVRQSSTCSVEPLIPVGLQSLSERPSVS